MNEILKVEVTTIDNQKLIYKNPSRVLIDYWRCGECEKPLDPDWEFCPYCGNPVQHRENGRFRAGLDYTR